MFPNMIVLSTLAELNDFLDHTTLDTLVGRVAFSADLLDRVRSNDNVFEIADPVDDGAWIEIDEMGYVVKDFGI